MDKSAAQLLYGPVLVVEQAVAASENTGCGTQCCGCRPDQTTVQVVALLKRSCLRTGKGPRHLYVTMCG